jgi:hypothetical protein
MTSREKTYILKHTADGLRLLRDRESDQGANEGESEDLPSPDTLAEPRWNHWYQRKLARPWQATLLGMNIEPISNARRILKAHAPDTYRTFRDRLDILQTLMGLEIGLYENHVREGEGANEKYIELAEYCRYAENLEWPDMDAMHKGLRLDVEPPTLNLTARHQNNILGVLDAVLRCAVKGYQDGKSGRSPAAVLKWLKENGEESIVKEPTLRNWFTQMSDLEERKRE